MDDPKKKEEIKIVDVPEVMFGPSDKIGGTDNSGAK